MKYLPNSLLSDAYTEGIKDAIKLIERGMFAGLPLKDSLECLKQSLTKTEKKYEDKKGAA